MSIRANFYKFTKTIDSTERPTGSGTPFDIVLKAPVTVTAPVIELDKAALDFNYCYIPEFKRYYFVQSATILTNDIIQYSLSVDVLATWKTEILASSLYVLRSASDYNLKLVDDTWTHTTDFIEGVDKITLPGYDSNGCYIISVVNNEDAFTINPAASVYVINPLQMVAIMTELFNKNNASYANIDDITRTYFNPQQYITSCRWYPFTVDSISTETATALKYGWYETSSAVASARPVKTYGRNITFSFTLGSYSTWADRSNDWTRYALYIPGFGTNEIDASYSGQTLTGKISVDYNTGQATCILTSGTDEIIASLSGTIGCEVAINQIATQNDFPTTLSGLATKGIETGVATLSRMPKGTAANIFKFVSGGSIANTSALFGEGYQAETLENIVNSGQDIAKAAAEGATATILQPTVTTKGADGARYTIIANHDIILYRRRYTHYNPAFSKLGGVCNQIKTLGNLSGYTQVANGLIEMPGTIEERNAITTLLEGGFIIA